MEHCAGHDELIRLIGNAQEANSQHTAQLTKVFDIMAEIQNAIHTAEVSRAVRDQRVEDLCEAVEKIDKKIENGLRADVYSCKLKIGEIADNIERRKRERILAEKQGVHGFVREGLRQTRSKLSLLVVGGTFFFVIWIVAKIIVFHESPLGFLKWIGIGG